MEPAVIPEPQRTYVLELITALGPAAEGFVLAGAQAMKFMLAGARTTKDFDFVLDTIRLRAQQESIAVKLQDLGYASVEGSRNFQFQKSIPGSPEIMRIEFMAPQEHSRRKDFRADIQNGVHARSCAGHSRPRMIATKPVSTPRTSLRSSAPNLTSRSFNTILKVSSLLTRSLAQGFAGSSRSTSEAKRRRASCCMRSL
jgi:hypothetical protein